MTAPLAIQLYTVREQVAALGLDAVLDRVAAAGYVGVESAGFADRTPQGFADALSARGLEHASADVGLLADWNAYGAQLDAHAEAGARMVVVPALAHDGFGDLDALKRNADALNRAAEQASARGLALGYHNHFWEMPAIDGKPALVRLFELTDPGVFAEVDIYWVQVGGVDPAALVRELGSRARLLHVKDGPADAPASDMTAVGEGKVDITGVLAAAPAAQWHIVELDRCATDMLAAVDASARYLLGHGLSIGRVVTAGTVPKARVALAGCGVIAPTYAETFNELGWIDLVACADAVPARAQQLADDHGIARTLTFDELLATDDVDAIVNLTPPLAHAEVTLAALHAGKAVFSEKPLGVDFNEGVALLDAAREHGLRLGCAPDTWLGPGLQTCRAAIEAGAIGEPVAATGFMLGRGPEWWHPNPDIFFKRGAGPLLDMGPYYLTALVELLGPATAVSAAARITRVKRPILSEPRRGEVMTVEVPTHVSASIEFASGPIATLVTSFDVLASRHRDIEIYGTEGTLAVPNPNTFGGPVRIRGALDTEWRELPLRTSSVPERRGIGAADMLWARASATNRAHRCSAELALHVLEIMSGAITAADGGERVALTTTCAPASLLPEGLALHSYDD